MVSNRLEWCCRRIQHGYISSIRVGLFIGGLCFHFLGGAAEAKSGWLAWEEELEELEELEGL